MKTENGISQSALLGFSRKHVGRKNNSAKKTQEFIQMENGY